MEETANVENVVAGEPTEKKKRGRPPRKSQPTPNINSSDSPPPEGVPTVSAEAKKEIKKVILPCPFINVQAEQIRVLVDKPQYSRPVEETKLHYVEKVCGKPADGINGYCHMHSYPVLAPVSKTVELERSQWIEINGKPEHVKKTETVTLLYNVGEHIDSSQFTFKELEEYFMSSLIGHRLGQHNVDVHRGKRHLDRARVDRILAENSPQEVASILKLSNFDTETLNLFDVAAKSDLIKEAIRGLRE